MTLQNQNTSTQISEILTYLQSGKGICQSEAYYRFGTQRLGGRIYDIRQKGIEIGFVWECGLNRYGRPVYFKRYFLPENKPKNAKFETYKTPTPQTSQNQKLAGLKEKCWHFYCQVKSKFTKT